MSFRARQFVERVDKGPVDVVPLPPSAMVPRPPKTPKKEFHLSAEPKAISSAGHGHTVVNACSSSSEGEALPPAPRRPHPIPPPAAVRPAIAGGEHGPGLHHLGDGDTENDQVQHHDNPSNLIKVGRGGQQQQRSDPGIDRNFDSNDDEADDDNDNEEDEDDEDDQEDSEGGDSSCGGGEEEALKTGVEPGNVLPSNQNVHALDAPAAAYAGLEIAGAVRVRQAADGAGYPWVELTTPYEAGHACRVELLGCRVSSLVVHGRETLVTAPEAAQARTRSSGIEVAWPQFGKFGSLAFHGIARTLPWTLESTSVDEDEGDVIAVFALRSDAGTRAVFAKDFALQVRVTLGPGKLALRLEVAHAGTAGLLSFTGGFLTNLSLPSLSDTVIRGLKGCDFVEQAKEKQESSMMKRNEAVLVVSGAVDRIYQQVSAPLSLTDPGIVLTLTSRLLPDVGLWSPGEGVDTLVQISSVNAFSPISITTGGKWAAELTLTAEPSRKKKPS